MKDRSDERSTSELRPAPAYKDMTDYAGDYVYVCLYVHVCLYVCMYVVVFSLT